MPKLGIHPAVWKSVSTTSLLPLRMVRLIFYLTAKAMEHLYSHSYLWPESNEEAPSDLLLMLRNDGGPLYGIMRRMGYHLDKCNAARSHQFDEMKALQGMFTRLHCDTNV